MDRIKFPHPEPDFFRTLHRPYYIAASEFIEQSAGMRAPFYLCHILNELGYEAYVTANDYAPGLHTHVLTKEIREKHRKERRPAIAVYSEAIHGNPLQGDVVVRWMLNTRGRIGYDVQFGPDDLEFYWHPQFSDFEDCRLLRLPTQDPRIFNRDGVDDAKRAGFCYYAFKYLRDGKGEIPDIIKKNGISLCQDIKRSKQEIADILRGAKALYIFEETALSMEAQLCGCAVVRVKTQHAKNMFTGNIANLISLEDIDINREWEYIPLSREQLKENDFPGMVNGFIQATQAMEGCARTGADNHDVIAYCLAHKRVYVYGGLQIGRQCRNVLRAMGIEIDGFICSDRYMTELAREELGAPVVGLSQFIETYDEDCAVLLAMCRANTEEVIPDLRRARIGYMLF